MEATSKSASRSRWTILAFLMALCFLSHFNRASITSAGDERIMKQFGISPAQMGLVYSSFLVVYTIFMIPGGWFIDRFGPRIALACMGIGSALFCAFTGSIGFGFLQASQVLFALLLIRSVMGLLTTPLHPASARSVGYWFPPERQAIANGLITGASILAYAVVHPIFGGLIDRIDWPWAFVLLGTLTAMLAAVWFVMASDRPPSRSSVANEPSAAIQSIGSLLTNRNLILLTLSYSAVGYFQYLFFYWLHYYFDSILHMEKAQSRFYAGLPSLAMAFSMPLGGWLTGKLVRREHAALLPKVGLFLSGIFLLAGITATDRNSIVLWFTLSLGVLGLCEASFWTLAVALGKQRGGTAAAIMNTGGNGVGLLAPWITPLVSAKLGWTWGIGLGAVVAFAGGLCWFAIRPNAESIESSGNQTKR